jgi:hypothetical protein
MANVQTLFCFVDIKINNMVFCLQIREGVESMDTMELLFQVPIEDLQKGYTRSNEDFLLNFRDN